MSSKKHVPGWEGIIVPEDIAELTQWFEVRFSGFKTIDVMVQTNKSDYPELSITTHEQSPTAVRSKLHSGRYSLNNVHRWLESQRYRDKPGREHDGNDLIKLETQMGKMLEWLQKQAGLRSNPNESTDTPVVAENASSNDQDLVGTVEERALQQLVLHPDWTKKRIAEQIGSPPRSLAKGRCPNFHEAMEAYHQRDLPSGTKSADGDLEAWDDIDG